MHHVSLTAACLTLLSLSTASAAGRGVTLHILVDRTMFNSGAAEIRDIRQHLLQTVTRLIPGVDTVRVGQLCGKPTTVFEARVSRDLGALARVLDRDVLKACTIRGSRLNAGLTWAAAGAPGALLLVTDAAFGDDPEAGKLPGTARAVRMPVAVIGARSGYRDAFDALFKSSQFYLGARGLEDAQGILRPLLRQLRR
jgi:hypothetical protein